MADPAKVQARQRFVEHLARNNLRLTSQREAIIETVFATDQHFTAEQLLEWSRFRDRTISKATVYRTLPLLVESGLVNEIDLGKDNRYYDPNYADHPEHNHIICTDCGKIIEFESLELNQLVQEISHNLGFAVKGQKLQIVAQCETLRRFGFCKHKQPPLEESKGK